MVKFAGEEVVMNWVNPTQSERNWRSTIVMTFHASPHLAFQLTNRYGTGGGSGPQG